MLPPTDRSELHAQFAAHFHCGEPPQTYPELALDAIEQALDTALPLSYRQFILRVGPVSTPAILERLVARQLDHPDLNHLLSPDEVIKNTRGYWAAGMPGNVIGIASDSMGSMFGFMRMSRKEIHPDDLPVWFFDHDYRTLRKQADSFDALLGWYVSQLPRVER
jgi:hypothetical protein